MPVSIGRRNCRGFTLLELIVVLLIIGLIAGLVVPKLTGPLGDLDLKTAAQKISASLRYARSQATAEKTTVVTLFDFEANRLVVTTPDVPSAPGTEGPLPGDGRAADRRPDQPPEGEQGRPGGVKAYRLPGGVRLARGETDSGDVQSGAMRIVFFPSGGSSGGTITVANERGRRYRIQVDFLTGQVTLAQEARS